MASTAQEYRNSGRSDSAKKRPALSRRQLAELLESVDLSCHREATIKTKNGPIQGAKRYRRDHLARTLLGVWRASGSPETNADGEIYFYAKLEGYAIESNRCERQMRYNLRTLERDVKILVRTSPANSEHRPITYALNIPRLLELRQRQSYRELKQRRDLERRRRLGQVTSIRTGEAAPQQPAPVPPPVVPVTPKPAAGQGFKQLNRSEVPRFVAEFLDLKQARPVPVPEQAFPLPRGQDPWQQILRHVERNLNPHSFETWLRPTQFAGVDGEILSVRVPREQFSHVTEKYAPLIANAIRDLGLPYREVDIVVPELTTRTFKEALEEACNRWLISPEHGLEVLKLSGIEAAADAGFVVKSGDA